MSRIYYYELRRFIRNRMFLGMFIISGLFAWFVLCTDILMGVAYTAPFSGYSYCTYLGKMLSFAVMASLLLLAGCYGKKQKKVEILTDAAPLSPFVRILVRTAAVGTCFLLFCAMIVGEASVFYRFFFHFSGLGRYLLVSLALILPCFLFFIGAGQLLGRVHQSLVYLLILAVFAVGMRGSAHAFDPFGTGYFSAYPLTLPAGADGEPAFGLSAAFVLARAVYLGIGVLCIYLNGRFSGHKAKRA